MGFVTAEDAPVTLDGNHVLFVTNDEDLLRRLGRVLRRQPFRLFTARCAEEAAWTLANHEIALLVSEERVSENSGSDLLARAEADHPHVMRALLVARPMDVREEAGVASGNYQVILKPRCEAELVQAIRDLLMTRQGPVSMPAAAGFDESRLDCGAACTAAIPE